MNIFRSIKNHIVNVDSFLGTMFVNRFTSTSKFDLAFNFYVINERRL